MSSVVASVKKDTMGYCVFRYTVIYIVLYKLCIYICLYFVLFIYLVCVYAAHCQRAAKQIWIVLYTQWQSILSYRTQQKWRWFLLMSLICYILTIYSWPGHLHHQISVGHGQVSNQTVAEKHLRDHLQGMLDNLLTCTHSVWLLSCFCKYNFNQAISLTLKSLLQARPCATD